MTSSHPPAPASPADLDPLADAAGTAITEAHIGCRVLCVGCGRAGEIDDVTPGGSVIVRHDASSWCVVPAARVGPVAAWNARLPP